MWDRFAPRLRKIIFSALEEASRRGAAEAGAEHLLIAVARDGVSAAAFILERAGVDRHRLIDAIVAKLPTAPPNPTRAESINAFALHVLDVAAGESEKLDDRHVGTEHVVIALARIAKGLAWDALSSQGFTIDEALAGRKAWIDAGMPRRINPGALNGGTPLLRPMRKLTSLLSLAWRVYGQLSIGHPGFVSNPYPLYAKLRKRWPVRADPIAPVYIVTRYTDVISVMKDPRFAKDPHLSASLPSRVREQFGLPPDAMNAVRGEPMAMLFIDPPRHTKVRAMFNKGFTPRALQMLRPRIQTITDKRLDRVASARGFDVMQELAFPLPTIVIAELMGFPPEDYPKLKQWSDDFAAALTINPTVEQTMRSNQSREELKEYFEQVVETLRRKPGENLISTLLAAGVLDEGQLSENEFFANSALLMAAGHETTSNAIGNGVLALLRHPDQLQLLRDDPSLISSAVEELLRYDTSVQWTSRVATEDIELSGVTIPRDTIVLASLGSANHDPDQFADPDRLDIRRADNKHVAFGAGIHYCLGASLARIEIETAIGMLIRRFPKMRLNARKIDWAKGVIFRGPRALPVRVD